MALDYSKMTNLDYGFRVSLPGKDVLSCPDKDLAMTSKSPCLKIVELGEVGFQIGSTGEGGAVDLTIAHEIPLPFLVKAYYYSQAVEAWWEVSSEDISFDGSNIYIHIYDTDNVINPILRYFILYA